MPPPAVRRDLGRRIAELRQARGFTQETIAERLGLSARYQQMIEAGEANFSIDTLLKIAAVLRVTGADLFAAPASSDAKPGRPKRIR